MIGEFGGIKPPLCVTHTLRVDIPQHTIRRPACPDSPSAMELGLLLFPWVAGSGLGTGVRLG